MLFLITLADSVEAAREYGRDALEQLLRVSMITQNRRSNSTAGGRTETDQPFRGSELGARIIPRQAEISRHRDGIHC